MSLDADGELVLWDTTVRDTGKIGNRLVDTLLSIDDHIRSVAVGYRVSNTASLGDGTFVVCHGKQQGIYDVATVAAKQASIVAALYSARLTMIVTVYTNEIVFWDSDDGTIVKRIEAEDLGRTEVAVDITSATLDDRERKVITGDSSGVVSVYNCATAVKIKSFPPIPSSVQYVMYTPDKTILVVGANGGLYVYDDRLTDVKEDFLLRDTRTHEADIVACSYSYTLGLIATADRYRGTSLT